MPYVIRFVLIVVGVLTLLYILFNSYTIGPPPNGHVEKRSFSEIVNQLNELNSATKTRAGSSVLNPQGDVGTSSNEGNPQQSGGTSTSDVSPQSNAGTSTTVKSQKKAGAKDSNK